MIKYLIIFLSGAILSEYIEQKVPIAGSIVGIGKTQIRNKFLLPAPSGLALIPEKIPQSNMSQS